MRKSIGLVAVLISLSFSSLATTQQPTDWIDPSTGHRVIQLSREPGGSSAYFTQNEFTPDGTKLVISTPQGISTIDLKTHAIESVVEGRARIIEMGRKTNQVYYMKDGAVYATDVNMRATHEIVKLPFRGGVSTVNADETLLAGSYVVGAAPQFQRMRRPAPPPPGRRGAAIESMLQRRWSMHLPMALFTVNIKTGEIKTFNHSTEWLNHVQFSPTDPHLLMFCHEGPWHLVDRIWSIRTDGTALTKIHTRTMEMEIAGHEFWGADGQTLWYDLQTPRGEDFWLAGYSLKTGERVWYHLQRNEWSVHYNVSPDGRLFAGDGGDVQNVAHATDGKWIYLFHPLLIPNRGVEQKGLIKPGVFTAEKLVNMSKHNYHLEPNVQFTPDGKWIVFRSNMSGATQVYEVEVNKE